MLEPRGFFSSGMLAVIRLWELNHTWRTGCLENNPEHGVSGHLHWTPKIRVLGKEWLWNKHGAIEIGALPAARGWEPALPAPPAWSTSHIFYPHLVGSSQNTRGGQKCGWEAGRERLGGMDAGWAGLAALRTAAVPGRAGCFPRKGEGHPTHPALSWFRNAR